MTYPRRTNRQELAVALVLAAGDPRSCRRTGIRIGPAGEDERQFVDALAEIECELIEREWAVLERLLPYLGENKMTVEDELQRARLVNAYFFLGWHRQTPESRL